jgi:hypothetical protein
MSKLFKMMMEGRKREEKRVPTNISQEQYLQGAFLWAFLV